MHLAVLRQWFAESGVPIRRWAAENGFSEALVYAVLAGRVKGFRGNAYHIRSRLLALQHESSRESEREQGASSDRRKAKGTTGSR